MAVEKELIALRKDYKISQKQISKAIGLSEEQYRRKELGQYDWRATEMFAIRNYLKPFIGPRSLNDIFYDKTTQNVYEASQKGENMNQLITITQNENNDQVVSGRELHEFLEVKTPYTQWFKDMCKYGFIENIDFVLVSEKSETNNPRNPFTTIINHALKLDMAKEISMIQRNEKGKQARQYFIEVEKELKQQLLPQTPEQQIALLAQGNVNLNKKVEQIENSVLDLTDRFGLPSNKAKVLQKKVASKVYMFTGGKYSNAHKKLGAKVFREFYKDLNNRFDVVKYSDIPLSRYDEATEYLDMWQPSFNTTLEIRGLNSQTSFDFEDQKGN